MLSMQRPGVHRHFTDHPCSIYFEGKIARRLGGSAMANAALGPVYLDSNQYIYGADDGGYAERLVALGNNRRVAFSRENIREVTNISDNGLIERRINLVSRVTGGCFLVSDLDGFDYATKSP